MITVKKTDLNLLLYYEPSQRIVCKAFQTELIIEEMEEGDISVIGIENEMGASIKEYERIGMKRT